MSYRYRILSKSEDWQREKDEKSRLEMDLAHFALEVASMKLKIKMPTARFIIEDGNGCISFDQRIDGYSPPGKEIFLRAGMAPARVVEIALHECRHCWQWSQPLWAGRSDDHCEKDAKLWTLEFWGARRVETDPEKILPQLCEIGVPAAMLAGDEQAAGFYIAELKTNRHPAAARLDKQFTEWCSNRERAESSRKSDLKTDLPAKSDQMRAVRDHYYNVVLPKQAERFIKPHLKPFPMEYRYSTGGIAK